MTTPSDLPSAIGDSWQLRVLPFMTRAIAVMGLLFFLSSSVQIHLMQEDLRSENKLDSEPLKLESFDPSVKADLIRWNGLLALEHETLRSRTQSTNAVILRQASLLHLGFLTGMVLCLVGAVFVIGRLQEPATSLSGETPQLKASLNTSSPGIVLATLGAGLICATLLHRYQFNLPDKVVYLPPAYYTMPSPHGLPLPTPPPSGLPPSDTITSDGSRSEPTPPTL